MRKEDNTHIEPEGNESNIIEKIVSSYLPYWPLLLLIVLLSLTTAYVYLRYATKIYAANATIIIRDITKGGGDINQSDLIGTNKSTENEIQVLQSRALMEAVVKRLFLYAPLAKEGKIKEGDAYMLSPVVVEARNTDSIIEVKNISIDYDKNSATVLLNKKDKYPVNQFVNTAYGVLKFTPNIYFKQLSESKRQISFSLEIPNNVAVGILNNMTFSSNYAIINLSYKDAIPQRAANILNNLIDVYEKKSLEDKNVLSRNTLAFANERLAVLGKDLDSIEKRVQQYKSGNNAANLSDQGGIILSTIAVSDQRIGEIKNQAAVLDELDRYVNGASKEGALVPSTLGVTDATLTGLLTKLYTSEADYAKLKATMGENSPKMIALAEEISKIKPDIQNNIKSQKASIAASLQSLSATSGKFNSMLSSLPAKERQLMVISREQQTKANLYQYLARTKDEAELSIANTMTNSHVVDKAFVGKDPVKPKSKIIALLALAGAFGLFVAIIIGKDLLTGKIKYRNEIEKMTSIPIIGEVAFDKSNTPIVIKKGTRTFVAEEFRKLRISLSFLGIDASHKKILLTSSISGEGKSFIATNLGISISLTGKKVVLVDMDLNNPSLSKILNVNYENGVTEFLTGEKTPEEIINKIDTHENLYFISAGSLPENPSELLASGKVKSLIDYLESHFDMVIIDTSPIVLVTDAYILSELCDATLYVIRHNYTPKMLVKRIDENNQINPINNPAIIFNGVKTRGVFKNNYGYGYDYVYGNKERGRKTKKAS